MQSFKQLCYAFINEIKKFMVFKILKVWMATFVIMASAAFLVCMILFPLNKAIFVSFIVGAVFSLFGVGFLPRALATDELEITSGNKSMNKSINDYKKDIEQHLKDYRFRYHHSLGSVDYYLPQGLYRVFESPIEVEASVYIIRVKASRMMIRTLKDLFSEIRNNT